MKELILLWDHLNLAHIAEHAVEPEEAREVVLRADRRFPRRIGPDRFMVRGSTKRGRHLQVIYVLRDPATVDPQQLDLEDLVALQAGAQVGYVIHSRDLREGEKRTVRKRR